MMRMTGEYVGGFIAGIGFGWFVASLTVAISVLSEPASFISMSAGMVVMMIGVHIARRAQQRRFQDQA
jgi:hypothetical protein